jgi:hypothetical protein
MNWFYVYITKSPEIYWTHKLKLAARYKLKLAASKLHWEADLYNIEMAKPNWITDAANLYPASVYKSEPGSQPIA